MKPHFSIVISATPSMMFQTKLLLNSLRTLGKCHDYYCTIFVMDEEIGNLDKQLEGMAEIVPYSRNHQYLYPWSSSPRWSVKPKGDVFIALDSDVIALGDISALYQVDGLTGVIASMNPFPNRNSLQEWKNLYAHCGLKFPDRLHMYRNYKQYFFMPRDVCMCPFYINHGVIAMPMKYVEGMNEAVRVALKKINSMLYTNYFIVQVATTVAAEMLQIPREPMDLKYNTQSKAGDPLKDSTILYHYNAMNYANNYKEFFGLVRFKDALYKMNLL